VCSSSFAQKKKKESLGPQAPPQALHDMYIVKANSNKLLGWTMFGTGISLTIGGMAKRKAPAFENNKGGLKLIWLPAVGLVTTIASIPMISSSKKLKRKANLILQDESAYLGDGKYLQISYPSVGIAFKF
jgi:hypothetical protein